MNINISIDKANIWDTIQQWAQYYSDTQEQLYEDHIGSTQFEYEQIEMLFQWKNQSILSGKKKKSLNDNILSEIEIINELKKQFDDQKFVQHFGTVSAVWQIFLKHVIAPNTYPIYDQNVHRAYLYLKGEKWQEIDETIADPKKLAFYHNEYLPFVRKYCKQSATEVKTFDKGMFALGQALKRIEKLHKAYESHVEINT